MTTIRSMSDLEGLPIVEHATAERLAEVREMIFEPSGGRILGFHLQGTGFFHGERPEVLPWENIEAVGEDAVLIQERSALRDDLHEEGAIGARALHGADLLLPDGDVLGEIREVFADVDEGVVVGFGIEAGAHLIQRTGRRAFVPVELDAAQEGVAVARPEGVDLAVPWPEAESQAHDLVRDLRDLTQRPVKALRAAAREAEIAGRSKMTKAELVRALIESGFGETGE